MNNNDECKNLPKKSWLIYKLGIGLFALLCGSLFFAPMICSNWSKGKIESHLETLLGGKVSIETLTLSWWGEQHCHQVRWNNEKSGIAITADSLTLSANLIDCLRYKEKPLKVFVEGTIVTCKANLSLLKIYESKLAQFHFSPIRALIQEGLITFERTEINIANSLQVITWGEVDLNKNRMNMTIGLPPKALKRLFKSIEVSEDYLLEIPISSKLNSKALQKKLISYFFNNYDVVKALKK